MTHHIVANFLASLGKTQHQESDAAPAVFIITPPSTQTTLAIATLLDQCLQSLPTDKRPDSTELLSRIQLLQYLSLSGLTESLGDVSASLFEPISADALKSPGMLLIQGVSATLADTQRRNGATHAAAVASNLMRSLTHLSRTYPNLLVLVDLDHELHQPASSIDGHTRGTLSSAFSSSSGEALALCPANTSVSVVLESGMDVILAVHDGFGKTKEHDRKEARKGGAKRGRTAIVEIVKDREGSGYGSWGVWVQQR